MKTRSRKPLPSQARRPEDGSQHHSGGDYVLKVPKGQVSPITQTRTTEAESIKIQVTNLEDGYHLVHCEDCYPPSGFRVGPAHWAAFWAPLIRRGEIIP